MKMNDREGRLSLEEMFPDYGAMKTGRPRYPVYHPISPGKLFLLSFFSFGFYDVYWFYQNWMIVRRRERSHISPLWRASIAPIYCPALFGRVQNSAQEILSEDTVHLKWLGLLYLLVRIASNIPWTYSLVLFPMGGVFLIPAQLVINRIHHRLDDAVQTTRSRQV
ncbi:MAG: hypothetical protein PHC51_06495 [bacterium]|nr:hypothetical protein [bacterium]